MDYVVLQKRLLGHISALSTAIAQEDPLDRGAGFLTVSGFFSTKTLLEFAREDGHVSNQDKALLARLYQVSGHLHRLTQSQSDSSDLKHATDALQELTAAYTLAVQTERSLDPSRLPAEVIALIVELAQSPNDFYAQQRDNMSFMAVSRDWYHAVAPRVRSEVHLTYGHEYMIEGLERLRLEQPERNLEVKVFSADIDYTRYMWQSDEKWYGQYLPDLFEWLGNSEICYLRVRPWPKKTSSSVQRAGLASLHFNQSDESANVTGRPWAGLSFFDLRPKIVELHYHIAIQTPVWFQDSAPPPAAHAATAVFLPGPDLRRLYITTNSPWLFPTADFVQIRGWGFDWSEKYHQWEVLSAPQLLIEVDILQICICPSAGPSILTHLEISVDLHGPSLLPFENQVGSLQEILKCISPTLRVLYLYIFDYPNDDGSPSWPRHTTERDQAYKEVVRLIVAMPNLHTLSLGGAGVSKEICPRSLRRAPELVNLTLLPCLYNGHTREDMVSLEKVAKEGSWDQFASVEIYRRFFKKQGPTGAADMVKLLDPPRQHFQALRYLTVYRTGFSAPKAQLQSLCRLRGIQVKQPPAYVRFWSRGPMNDSGLGTHDREVLDEEGRLVG